jgi:hypothetical protein
LRHSVFLDRMRGNYKDADRLSNLGMDRNAAT